MSILTQILKITIFLLLQFHISELKTVFKATKVECNSLDATLSQFEYCRVKPVKRDITEVTIHMNHVEPLKTIQLNVEILRKLNTYEPFIINITADLCAFLKTRRGGKQVDIFYKLVKDTWNLNHSCPFEHPLRLEKLILKIENLILPIPSGDYMFLSRWTFNRKRACDVKVWFTIGEPTPF